MEEIKLWCLYFIIRFWDFSLDFREGHIFQQSGVFSTGRLESVLADESLLI